MECPKCGKDAKHLWNRSDGAWSHEYICPGCGCIFRIRTGEELLEYVDKLFEEYDIAEGTHPTVVLDRIRAYGHEVLK